MIKYIIFIIALLIFLFGCKVNRSEFRNKLQFTASINEVEENISINMSLMNKLFKNSIDKPWYAIDFHGDLYLNRKLLIKDFNTLNSIKDFNFKLDTINLLKNILWLNQQGINGCTYMNLWDSYKYYYHDDIDQSYYHIRWILLSTQDGKELNQELFEILDRKGNIILYKGK